MCTDKNIVMLTYFSFFVVKFCINGIIYMEMRKGFFPEMYNNFHVLTKTGHVLYLGIRMNQTNIIFGGK